MDQLKEQEIVIVFLIGTIGMLSMLASIAFFIVSYQKKLMRNQKRMTELELEHARKMINAQLESQERERVRIAAELHDSLGSLLWGVKLNASYVQRVGGPNPVTDPVINEMNTILDLSIETVRRISWELTPQVFKEAGLSNSVRRLCERLNDKGGQQIEFKNNSDVLWNNDGGLNAYRIVQELLNNAIKHSGAEKISVSLDWRMDTLEIQIEDNGKGFELKNAREGVGWWNVTQRANQLKAKIHIGKPPIGTGSSITLTIPLEYGNT